MRSFLVLVAFALVAACAGSEGEVPGGAGGSGGAGAAGGDGGGAEAPGGSGGSGGAGGTAGGGAGGIGGAGGAGGCGDGSLETCAPLATRLLHSAELVHPANWGVIWYELPGTVAAHGGHEEGGRRLAIDGGVPGARVELRYGAAAGMEPPFAPGDEITARFDSIFGDHTPGLLLSSTVSLYDGAGRLRWKGHHSENAGLGLWDELRLEPAAEPLCEVELDHAGSLQAFGSYAVAVSLDRHGEVQAEPGRTTTLDGDGRRALFLLDRALRQAPACNGPDGYTDSLVGWSLLVTVPEPVGASCTADADCDGASYCERGGGGCGDAGVCRQRPESCGGLQRVCACDGNTYVSPCEANRAGTDVALVDAPSCEGGFACGAGWCRDTEACVVWEGDRGRSVAVCQPLSADRDVPPGCDLDAPTCACSDWSGCTCTEGPGGRIDILCD